MSEFQNRVDQLELGPERNHEVIMAVDRKVEGSIGGLDGALSQMWENITQMREEMGAQLQQFMVMFAHQNSVRIAPDFPPRKRTNPIL